MSSVQADGIDSLLLPFKKWVRKLSFNASVIVSGGIAGKGKERSFQPRDVEYVVLKALTKGVRIFSNSVYVPNKIILKLCPEDMAAINPYMSTFMSELSKTVKQHIAECMADAKNADGGLLILIEQDAELKHGQFECVTELVDGE